MDDSQPPAWTHLSPAGARLAGRLLAVAGVMAFVGAADHADLGWILSAIVFLVVGALILNRWPAHRVGWLFVWYGVGTSFSGLGSAVIGSGLTGPLPLPAADASAWVTAVSLVCEAANTAVVAGLVPLSLLLFPDGRLPSHRWRWAVGAAAVTAVAGAVSAVLNGGWGGDPAQAIVLSPWLDTAAAGLLPQVFFPLLGITWLASAGSQLWRYRGASGVQRLQQRWLAAAVVFAALAGVSILFLLGDTAPDAVAVYLIAATFAAPPLAAGAAILRSQLFDIDLVIRRSFVAALLLACVTFAYVVLVVSASGLLGARVGASPAVALTATAVVALAFQPARERLSRVATRIVYGRRATPYEVLSTFAREVSATAEPDILLTRAAAALASGTGAANVTVWLRVGAALRPSVRVPDGASQPACGREVELGAGNELPDLGADVAVPVRREGELLGAVTLRKPRGEPASAEDDALTRRLAGQLGVALTNLRLGAELVARAEELAASRLRIVSAAQDQRRLLEQRLTAGAGQRLLALRRRLDAAPAAGPRAPRARAQVARLGPAVDDTMAALGRVAGGIAPALLSGEGLGPALAAAAAGGPVRVTVDVEAAELPPEVLTAVYYCVLEALQNTAKHAGASAARVTVALSDGVVGFTVSDDGCGYDPLTTPSGAGTDNLRDRVAALDGTLSVRSAPGAGTTVEGRIPLRRVLVG